jgi:hypothetical protein
MTPQEIQTFLQRNRSCIEMKTEFAVDEVESLSDGVLVRGALYQGVLRLGDVFSTAHRITYHPGTEPGHYITERSHPRSIRLRVESISAYEHSFDELYAPISAELKLSGQGTEIVQARDLLEIWLAEFGLLSSEET